MGSVWPQGFGTTLTVTYSATDPKFNTLGKAMRVLIVPGDLRLMVSHSPLPGFSEDTTMGCAPVQTSRAELNA